MKNLFEYLISAAFAVLLVAMTYSYFVAALVNLIQISFEPLAR